FSRDWSSDVCSSDLRTMEQKTSLRAAEEGRADGTRVYYRKEAQGSHSVHAGRARIHLQPTEGGRGHPRRTRLRGPWSAARLVRAGPEQGGRGFHHRSAARP